MIQRKGVKYEKQHHITIMLYTEIALLLMLAFYRFIIVPQASPIYTETDRYSHPIFHLYQNELKHQYIYGMNYEEI